MNYYNANRRITPRKFVGNTTGVGNYLNNRGPIYRSIDMSTTTGVGNYLDNRGPNYRKFVGNTTGVGNYLGSSAPNTAPGYPVDDARVGQMRDELLLQRAGRRAAARVGQTQDELLLERARRRAMQQMGRGSVMPGAFGIGSPYRPGVPGR